MYYACFDNLLLIYSLYTYLHSFKHIFSVLKIFRLNSKFPENSALHYGPGSYATAPSTRRGCTHAGIFKTHADQKRIHFIIVLSVLERMFVQHLLTYTHALFDFLRK